MLQEENNKVLMIPIHRINEKFPSVWKYINNEDNWIAHHKGTFIKVDKAEEFALNEHKTLEEFDKFVIDNEYDIDFDPKCIKYHREILEYILSLNMGEFDTIMISYDW